MAQGINAKCLELAAEALECIQNRPIGQTSKAVRKLELCANLIKDQKLAKWCDFQLGEYENYLALPESTHKTEGKAEINKKDQEEFFAKLRDLDLDLSAKEITTRIHISGGGLASIEFIESMLEHLNKKKLNTSGDYYLGNLTDTITTCANAASKHATRLYSALSFGNIPSRQFDVIRERVDELLLDLCPEAIEKFMAAYQMLGSKSSEDWSLALTACRRVIKAVADTIYPPSTKVVDGRKLGDQQYINRLWVFMVENIKNESDRDLAKAHVDYLGSFLKRLDAKASKGVHSSVTYEETVRAVLYTYLTLGDILELTPTSLKQVAKAKGKLDINNATIDELCQVPGFPRSLAKEIIKGRAKKKFSSLDDLLKIKGVGNKTLEKFQPHLIAIT